MMDGKSHESIYCGFSLACYFASPYLKCQMAYVQMYSNLPLLSSCWTLIGSFVGFLLVQCYLRQIYPNQSILNPPPNQKKAEKRFVDFLYMLTSWVSKCLGFSFLAQTWEKQKQYPLLHSWRFVTLLCFIYIFIIFVQLTLCQSPNSKSFIWWWNWSLDFGMIISTYIKLFASQPN